MYATIAEELTAEDIPIERLVQPGQKITGWRDLETNRVDVRASLRASTDALASFREGDVVLTRVVKVRNGKAELALYPQTSTPAVTVAVLRADVTTNPHDDLRTLMTVGEVVAARIVATGPKWALTLLDIDDDDAIVPAPALLTGSSWLVEEVADADLTISGSPSAPALPMPTSVPTIAADVATPAVPAPHALHRRRRRRWRHPDRLRFSSIPTDPHRSLPATRPHRSPHRRAPRPQPDHPGSAAQDRRAPGRGRSPDVGPGTVEDPAPGGSRRQCTTALPSRRRRAAGQQCRTASEEHARVCARPAPTRPRRLLPVPAPTSVTLNRASATRS